MKVLFVEPGKEARELDMDDGLENMQKAVGGMIQAVYPYEDPVAIVCNEEGKLLGLPFNRGLYDESGQLYDVVSGSFFICGLGDDNFISLSPELMEKYREKFLEPEALVQENGKLITVKLPEVNKVKETGKEEIETSPAGEIFSAYITNLGKYTEGELVGEWVQFPTTQEEIQAVFKQIGVDGIRYEEFFITDYDCNEFPGLSEYFGEYANIDELNYLACKLENLDEWERETYKAVLDFDVSNIEGAINLTENLDCYCLYSDVGDDSDLGYYYIEEAGIYDLKEMGNLANYIDYEKFGRDVRLEEGGCFTEQGYVYMQDNPSDFYRSEQDIPEECKIFAYPERPVAPKRGKEEQSHER